MRVEYEPIIDVINRTIKSARDQGKNIKRIVLRPDEYDQLRDEWNSGLGACRTLPKLPASYKDFNGSISAICSVPVVVEAPYEIRKNPDQQFHIDIGRW